MQLAAGMSRLGTESAFEVLARATRLQQEGRSIINLGIGQPDFPTPPHIVEAAVQALRDGLTAAGSSRQMRVTPASARSAFKVVWVSTTATLESSSMKATRSFGYTGSSGK